MRVSLFLLCICSFGLYAQTVTNTGKNTYQQYCMLCHEEGVAGAPRFRDEKDWQPRLNNRTVDDLVASAAQGLNSMPSQGTCSECTQDEIKEAIQYMLPRHD